MADEDFVKASSSKDELNVGSTTTTLIARRVNYYFAKPKEQQTPMSSNANEERYQQHQPKSNKIGGNKKHQQILHDHHHYTTLEKFGESNATTKNGRNETILSGQTEYGRSKKVAHACDKDSRAQTTSEFEKCVSFRTLPKGIFGKKTKVNEIVADYDRHSPILLANDPLLCSEPFIWPRKSKFSKRTRSHNFSIFNANFLQIEDHSPKRRAAAVKKTSKKRFEKCSTKINYDFGAGAATKASMNISLSMLEQPNFDDARLTDFKTLDINPIPDLPGSENLL